MKRHQKQENQRQRSFKQLQIHVARTLSRNELALVPIGQH